MRNFAILTFWGGLLLGIKASQFYQDGDIFPYACNFEASSPINFDCACVTGLWFLHNACGSVTTISGGHQYCTELNVVPVSKGVQILNSPSDLTLLVPNGTVIYHRDSDFEATLVDNDFVLVTGSEWILRDTSGQKVCLSPLPNSYCFFSNVNLNLQWKLDDIKQSCQEGHDVFVDPIKCYKIGVNNENVCETDILSTSPDDGETRVVKRQAPSDPSASGAAPAAGPAPAGAGSNTSMFQDMMPEDEDYAAAMSNKTDNTTESPISIEKGIIDYMDLNLDVQLDLPNLQSLVDGPVFSGRSQDIVPKEEDASAVKGRGMSGDAGAKQDEGEYGHRKKENPLNVTYANPVYEFLELSKRIMQKTCPSFYVKSEFLNMAVATFIRLQQLEFKFPENTFKPSGFRRVLNFLRNCEANATAFNFSDFSCDGTYHGKYSAFGENFEMTISSVYADLDRDPIVETVWKIFFNAHSYCFSFFNKTLDHHRFASWMIPLFQNEMNDLWTRGKTTNMSLNGLFGNQVIVQGHLGYCVGSSRLVSQYPWDLPRPMRISGGNDTDTAAAGAGAPGAAPAAPNDPNAGRRRKRRDTEEIDLGANDPGDENICSDTRVPILCPNHIANIAIAKK